MILLCDFAKLCFAKIPRYFCPEYESIKVNSVEFAVTELAIRKSRFLKDEPQDQSITSITFAANEMVCEIKCVSESSHIKKSGGYSMTSGKKYLSTCIFN